MRWLGRIGLLLLVLVAAGTAAGAWLIGTEAGLGWALARAQSASGGKLAVEGARGVLAGAVSFERLAYRSEGTTVEARGVRTELGLLEALGGRLALDPLQVEFLEIVSRPDGAPASAGTPAVPIALDGVHITRLEILREGTRHALRDVRLSGVRLDRSSLAAEGSLTRPDERFPAQASFKLGGTPERIELAATLEVAGIPARLETLLRPGAEPVIEALRASGGPLDLSRFDPGLPRTEIRAQVEAKAASDGALAGTLAAENAAHGPLDAQRVPVARLQTRFATRDFRSATLDALQMALSGTGTLRGKGALSADAVQAELQAAGIDLASIRSSLRATRLDGPLSVRLTREAQRVSGRLAQDDIAIEAELERRGDLVEVRRLRAAAAGGELSGAGTLILPELRFEAKLELARFDPSAFGDYPQGSLNASLVATGTRREADVTWTLRESTLLGRALASRGSARIAERRVSELRAEARYDDASVAASGALGSPGDRLSWRIDAPRLSTFAEGYGGALEASGSLSGSWEDPEAAGAARVRGLELPGPVQASEVRVKFAGRLSRHELELSARAPEIELEARLRGGWRAPEGWTGELQSLSNAGTYPLRSTGPAPLAFSRRHLSLGRLEARLGEGRLVIAGLRWQPGQISSSGEFRGLPAQWLAALTPAGARVGGSLLLEGAWSLQATPRLEGTVRVARAGGDLSIDEVALGLGQASLAGRFSGGRLELQGSVASRFGTMALEGTVDPEDGAPAIGASSRIALRARMDFAAIGVLARPFLEEGKVDGRLRAQLAAAGTLAQPVLSGELEGEKISFELARHGIYLRNGVLRARLDGAALHVAELSLQGGEGSFRASGTLPLALAEGAPARLDWQARRFTAIERPDAQLVVSGAGEARFDGKRLSLVGDLRADRGRFELARERLPQLGDDVVVVGETRPGRQGEVRLPVALDLILDLGDQLMVRARGFEGRVAGRVQLQTNKEGELRAYGEVRAVNATFLAYGQTLQVDPGVLIFDGPLDNPSLQVTAWRRNQAVEAGVQISGTARTPRVQLVSQPPVPEGERLSWLVLGRAPGDASQADLGLLQAAAGALLSSDDAAPLDRRLARSLGLDEVSLRGSGEVQERVVAFGKRLSDRVYVSYERGLGALASNLVKLDYALSQRWSVRAETGSTATGSATSGWGLFYRFSWD